MDVLTVLLILTSFFLQGCGANVGPEKPWVSWDQITGDMKPEVSNADLSSGGPTTAPKTLRVVTFNLHFGEDVDGIVRALQGNQSLASANVILIQEIQSYPDENGSRASRLAHSLQMAYAYAPAKPFNKGTVTGTHGNGIFSQYPLSDVKVMELPHGNLGMDEERRIALTATIPTSSGTLQLITVHLDTRLNPAERVLQLRPAIYETSSSTIVGGDFNTNPLLWAFNLLPILSLYPGGASDQAPILDDYVRSLNYQTPTESFGNTVDFPGINARIDSIYIKGGTPDKGAVERGISVSDHWPVWLDVTQN